MIRGSVLLIALLATAPTIWAAFADQTVSVTSALVHYLIAVPIVGLLVGLVRLAAKPSQRPAPVREGPTDRESSAG